MFTIETARDLTQARMLLSPPGDTLSETLELAGMTQKELAIRCGRPLKTINEIMKGKAAIIPETAIDLELVLGIPATFWLERERNYRLQLAQLDEAESMLDDAQWLKQFPVATMRSLGWLKSRSPISLMYELLSFFGVASPEAYLHHYADRGFLLQFRNHSSAHDKHALAAWLRKGELDASALETGKYSAAILRDSLPALRSIMATEPNDYFEQMQLLCKAAGVKLVYTPCLPHVAVSGATRWIGDTPLIQLSARYKRYDSFWFTFFHELGHILLHGKRELFLENVEYTHKDKVKEKEADEFAIQWTLSHDQEAELANVRSLNPRDIKRLAPKLNTHPSVIVGRLQHLKLISYSEGTKFIKAVDLSS